MGTLIATLAVPFFWTPPALLQAALMALMGVIAGCGHLSPVYGFGQAQACALAPFNYTSLVWATLFGYLFVAELPDAATVAGPRWWWPPGSISGIASGRESLAPVRPPAREAGRPARSPPPCTTRRARR